ncbi:MAG: flagellar protein FliT [Lachnospiraceae bacterium]
MDNNASYISLMIDSLERKRSLFGEIKEQNKIIRGLLDEAQFDADKFDGVVEKKTGIFAEIDKLDDGFQNLYDRVKTALQENKSLYTDDIRRMQELIKDIMELSSSIESEEKRMKGEIMTQFGKLKDAVKETRKNSTAVSNYYKSMSRIDSEPQFMDQKK